METSTVLTSSEPTFSGHLDLTSGLQFSLLDYGLFGLMLGLSTLIGIYFGFFSKRKQNNTMEYLMGSKQMSVIPVAISLTATHISAVTILGVPAEMYRFGTQYWAAAISGIIVTVAMAYFYLPVFYELQSTSIYTYLERRFDGRQKKLASAIFTFASIIYLPLIIYAPAIAFSQVTGVNLHVITPIMCVICIFYTTFGGVRAVVWTDTLQFVSMVLGIGVVMVLGVIAVGGLGNLYDIADRGGRLIWFDMDPNPTSRSTFFTTVVGLTSMWISIVGVTPECLTRFLSVPTYADSKRVVFLFGFGHILVKMLAVFCGVIIYAKYETCDPVTIGEVKKADQIFPYYVMDIARSVPGLPGLFVAGVFSAALSSMSSSLNVLGGTIYVDFLKPMYPKSSEQRASSIMKIIVMSIGLLSLILVFVVERLGNIFSLAISIVGVTSGTLLGMFTLGMAFPKANRHGAFWGSIASLVIVTILSTGAQLNIAQGKLIYPTLPFRTDGCEDQGFLNYENSTKFIGTPNSTIHIYNARVDSNQIEAIPWIFRLSFMYYSLIGTLIVFIVGYPISLMTGGCDNVDERLLWPIVRRYFIKCLQQKKQQEAEMHEILKPLNNVNVENNMLDK